MQAEEEQNPEETEEALNACSILTEYDGKVIGKLVDKVYIYNDKNMIFPGNGLYLSALTVADGLDRA